MVTGPKSGAARRSLLEVGGVAGGKVRCARRRSAGISRLGLGQQRIATSALSPTTTPRHHCLSEFSICRTTLAAVGPLPGDLHDRSPNQNKMSWSHARPHARHSLFLAMLLFEMVRLNEASNKALPQHIDRQSIICSLVAMRLSPTVSHQANSYAHAVMKSPETKNGTLCWSRRLKYSDREHVHLERQSFDFHHEDTLSKRPGGAVELANQSCILSIEHIRTVPKAEVVDDRVSGEFIGAVTSVLQLLYNVRSASTPLPCRTRGALATSGSATTGRLYIVRCTTK